MSESLTESRISPPDRSLTRECDACVTKREQIWTVVRRRERRAKLMDEADLAGQVKPFRGNARIRGGRSRRDHGANDENGRSGGSRNGPVDRDRLRG